MNWGNRILNYQNGSFTSTDLEELWYWANTCSYLYGNATVLAQNGYNCIQRESHVFEENCPSNLQKNMQIVVTEQKENLLLTLFPNPTSGYLFVKSNDVNVIASGCIIRGLDGREIYNGLIDFQKGLSLSNLNIATGVYSIELNVDASKEIIRLQFMYLK